MNNLSADSEFRYIVQWFSEWSELQREDFVPVLVEYLLVAQGESASVDLCMNGMVNSVSIKPMSLFQCRIKLFRQWCPKWPAEFKHKLKEKIIEMDSKVGDKIIAEIKLREESRNLHINGNENGNGNEEENENEAVESAVNAGVSSSIDDSRLAAVLHNETAVDDDNDAAQTVSVYDKPAEQVEIQENIATTVSSSAEVPSVA